MLLFLRQCGIQRLNTTPSHNLCDQVSTSGLTWTERTICGNKPKPPWPQWLSFLHPLSKATWCILKHAAWIFFVDRETERALVPLKDLMSTSELQHPSQEKAATPRQNQPAKSTAPCFHLNPVQSFPHSQALHFLPSLSISKMFSLCIIQQPSMGSKLSAPCEELSQPYTQSRTNPDLKWKAELP